MMWHKRIPAAYVRHGVKTGVASLLAYEGSRFLGLPYAYWAVISTVIVMQVYVADSVRMCLYRFFGTAMGAAIGIFSIWVFPKGELWNDAAIFTTLGFCALMTRFSPRYRMAAITVGVVMVGSFGAPMEERVVYALWRVVEITVGVVSAFLISVILFPERLEKELLAKLSRQRRWAGGLCRSLCRAFVKNDVATPSDEVAELSRQVHDNRASFSGITHHELLFSRRKKGETLSASIQRMEQISRCLTAMEHALSSEALKKEPFYMEDELLALSEACASFLEQEADQDDHSGHLAIKQALSACGEHLNALRREGATHRFDVEMLSGFYGFYNALIALARECLAL